MLALGLLGGLALLRLLGLAGLLLLGEGRRERVGEREGGLGRWRRVLLSHSLICLFLNGKRS